MSAIAVERFTPYHSRWPAYVAHLERVAMARDVALEPDGRPKDGAIYLGVVAAGEVVGNIAITVQDMIVPATEWSGGRETPLTAADGRPLRETFVESFGVEEAYRRRGFGRVLQLAALDLTRALGCYQMRSWSSVDKQANYALKLALGFAAHPAIYVSRRGVPISGVYWVKTV
jgi:GNAT superfamily N-acetyltransferase